MKSHCIIIAIILTTLVREASAETYEYDAVGRVSKVTYVGGNSVTYVYDSRDNLTQILPSAAPPSTPLMPLARLQGPKSSGGQWGFRQIWFSDGTQIESLETAIALAQSNLGEPGFRVHDTTVPWINHAESSSPGGGGLNKRFFLTGNPSKGELEFFLGPRNPQDALPRGRDLPPFRAIR